MHVAQISDKCAGERFYFLIHPNTQTFLRTRSHSQYWIGECVQPHCWLQDESAGYGLFSRQVSFTLWVLLLKRQPDSHERSIDKILHSHKKDEALPFVITREKPSDQNLYNMTPPKTASHFVLVLVVAAGSPRFSWPPSLCDTLTVTRTAGTDMELRKAKQGGVGLTFGPGALLITDGNQIPTTLLHQ